MTTPQTSAAPEIIGIIPAYQPDGTLPALVREICRAGFLAKIIVADDGSGAAYREIFRTLRAMTRVSVVTLSVNSGTGGAIKAGIRRAFELYPELGGVVTFDADGQHLPIDVQKVVEAFRQEGRGVIVGQRDFHSRRSAVPWRSKVGNRLAEYCFGRISGVPLSDTQCGLRCYDREAAAALLQIAGNRYEFQMQALRLAVNHYPVRQVPIATVYENGNRNSHFRPLLDSLRIAAALMKNTGG